MKIQDNCFVYNRKCTETVFAKVLWMEKEQRMGRHFLNINSKEHGFTHLAWNIFFCRYSMFFFCGISTQTLQCWPWRSKGRNQSNPKPWLGLGSLRWLVGWRMTTGSGKFLESDPCSNRCSQLILCLLWRRSCCHNHSGHSFSRARDCSLLQMGGWNCLNSYLCETKRKKPSQERPGDTMTAPALCSGKASASAANESSVIGTTPSTKTTARTEPVIRRSFHPLPTWDGDRRFAD